MDRAIVENEDDWPLRPTRAGSIGGIEPAQQGDEVPAALGGAGIDEQPAGGEIEAAEYRPLGRAPRRLNPQILAPLGPGVSEIGRGERLRFIPKQQRDIAGVGLLFQQAQAQSGAVNRVGIPGAGPRGCTHFSASIP